MDDNVSENGPIRLSATLIRPTPLLRKIAVHVYVVPSIDAQG